LETGDSEPAPVSFLNTRKTK